MKTSYANLFNPSETPQTEPMDDCQVQNNAGGYGYGLDKWKRLERFLILGSDGGTYYQSARKLTRENGKIVEECWKEDAIRTANLIHGISVSGRAPKNDPAIFALALGAISENDEARKASLSAVASVCRTGTHLFQFVRMAMDLGKGFGRGMKRAIAGWYDTKDVDRLAYQVVKYRSREGLTHENLLDLAHPKTNDPARNAVYSWLVGKNGALENLPAIINDHVAAMYCGETDKNTVLEIIRGNKSLPWEALPTWANANAAIQSALLPGMGLTAIIRNLGNLTRIGVITPMSNAEQLITNRLTIEDEIKRSRVHPMQILMALKVYSSGRSVQHGSKTSSTWHPNQKIVNALNEAFYLAFQNVEPTGKRHFIGIDVSGSMRSPVSGNSILSCAEAAAALALVTAKTEPKTFIGRFNNGIETVPFSEKSRLDDVLKHTGSFNWGATDCALPMLYALEHKIEADVFVVLTDNETHSGRMHPMQALKKYRRKTGINAKLIVVGMTSSGFSIADPADGGCLDVVGFDTAVPSVMAEFVKG